MDKSPDKEWRTASRKWTSFKILNKGRPFNTKVLHSHIECLGNRGDVLLGGEGSIGKYFLDNAHCFYKGFVLRDE